MSTEKRYIPLKEAAKHPECPWASVQAARGAFYRASPVTDSSGHVTHKGDPELASCFVQLAAGGPLLVDMQRLSEVVESRRVAA